MVTSAVARLWSPYSVSVQTTQSLSPPITPPILLCLCPDSSVSVSTHHSAHSVVSLSRLLSLSLHPSLRLFSCVSVQTPQSLSPPITPPILSCLCPDSSVSVSTHHSVYSLVSLSRLLSLCLHPLLHPFSRVHSSRTSWTDGRQTWSRCLTH